MSGPKVSYVRDENAPSELVLLKQIALKEILNLLYGEPLQR